MSIRFRCDNCGKQLKTKDSSAGKKVKCPGCGDVLVIPEPVVDAVEERPDAYDDGYGDDQYGDDYGGGSYDDNPFGSGDLASYGTDIGAPGGDKRKPCPMCGEMIQAAAVKCRFCGEIFDPKLKKKKKKRSSASDEDSDLNAGEIVVAVICSGIGCIIGIIWMIQGKPKGIKMLGISLLAAIFWNILNALLQVAIEGAG